MNVKDKIDDILKSLKLELPSSLNIDFYKIFYLLLFLIIYIKLFEFSAVRSWIW